MGGAYWGAGTTPSLAIIRLAIATLIRVFQPSNALN